MGKVDDCLILGHGLIEICISLEQCSSAWGLMFFFHSFWFLFCFSYGHLLLLYENTG
jgi:hypothetical protein